jgi:2-methylcitrate dehydratase PrpD
MKNSDQSLPFTNSSKIMQFVNELEWSEIPADVKHIAARCTLDLCATLVAGSVTELSHAVRSVAVKSYGGDESTLLLDGRKVSAAGAAMANGMTIDGMDIHDGYRLAKGHAGAAIFPAALAMGEVADWHGEDYVIALVIGYEIALRAGLALHKTAVDYHTSGAWNALGAAAIAARAFRLDTNQTRHALGIAEYHGPRSQMMRCIDHPSMLKDGSGWGSMVGVVASQLAAEGFTGAPALTLEDEQVHSIWKDLGSRWLMRDLYFKDFACCRWTQPAIEGALKLRVDYQINPSEIKAVTVHTFEEATHLSVSRPVNTEQAQYSLPFPLAAALISGCLDPQQVLPPSIFDEDILQLADNISIVRDDVIQEHFPGKALARVEIELRDGRKYQSEVHSARGDPMTPLSDVDLVEKFNRLAGDHLSAKRLNLLQRTCWNVENLERINELIALISSPPDKVQKGE